MRIVTSLLLAILLIGCKASKQSPSSLQFSNDPQENAHFRQIYYNTEDEAVKELAKKDFEAGNYFLLLRRLDSFNKKDEPMIEYEFERRGIVVGWYQTAPSQMAVVYNRQMIKMLRESNKYDQLPQFDYQLHTQLAENFGGNVTAGWRW